MPIRSSRIISGLCHHAYSALKSINSPREVYKITNIQIKQLNNIYIFTLKSNSLFKSPLSNPITVLLLDP
jgi:hypothetical protein